MIFFFTKISVQKILKNFSMHKTWWKKRCSKGNLFFHQVLCQVPKIFQKIHKTWWKKRFVIDIFFFTKFCVRNEKFLALGIKFGEKKDFYIVNFFFTKFHAWLKHKTWWKKRFLYRDLFFHQKLAKSMNFGEKKADTYLSVIVTSSIRWIFGPCHNVMPFKNIWRQRFSDYVRNWVFFKSQIIVLKPWSRCYRSRGFLSLPLV